MLTGEDTGVMKAAEAATATVMANGMGDMSSACAVAMATGAMSTAVAVLEINRPITAVRANSAAIRARGPASPSSCSRPLTARSIPPVFCRALS